MLESIVASLLSSFISESLNRLFTKKEITKEFDYILTKNDGRKIAIEVSSKSPSDKKLAQLFENTKKYEGKIDEFILVTPDSPSAKAEKTFKSLFEPINVKSNWIKLNDFPKLVGAKNVGDLTDPKVIDELKTKSLVQNIALYSSSPIGTNIENAENKIYQKFESNKSLPIEYRKLERQIAHSIIAQFYKSKKPLSETLNVGQKIKNVTIVLSDLINFSTLVKVSRPEDLNEVMKKYYTKARELVFDHRGTLDKFIGDAVLAIFGYPNSSDHSSINAIEFSTKLIRIGDEQLKDLLIEINEEINTGTRIGIATGDVWVLDIGDNDIEISFVGDVINLAARLEKNCDKNSILIDNRTKTKALKENSLFFESNKFRKRILEPSQARGQLLKVISWQSNPVVS